MACYIYNRTLSRNRKASPYKIWKGRKPNLNYLEVWRCLAFYRIPDQKRAKLGLRAIKGIFIGYVQNSKANRTIVLVSNTIVESRKVEFIENKFINDSTQFGIPQKDTEVSQRNKLVFHILLWRMSL